MSKRILVASLAAAAFLLQLAWAVWRGTVVQPLPAPPTSAASAPVTALVLQPDGRCAVWAARVVPHPPAAVWQVITDYPAFPRIFPGMQELSATPAGGNDFELTGSVKLLGRTIPLRTRVTHEPGHATARVHWDLGSPELPVNRGSWTLETVPEGTRVSYLLDVEVAGIPGWAVRAYLRGQVGMLLDLVAAELGRRQGGRT